MFSQTVEYALRAVVCLAQTDGRPLTTQQIAQITHVPAGYLSKVLQSLGRSELVRSQRGMHGGFVLGANANELTLLQVINAVDPVKRIHRCPLSIDAHHGKLCCLHQKLNDAMKTIERTLGETTISEVITENHCGPRPLCDALLPVNAGAGEDTEI